MTVTLPGSVDLLGRALGFTCARLDGVRGGLLDRPTPCARWRLADLLVHMEDALDAFTEAAGGTVAVHLSTRPAGRVDRIRAQAQALFGLWGGVRPADVVVGGLDLAAPLLVSTAALEVAVHGWDVGQSTGERVPLPDDVATALVPIAHATVLPADRGVRFGPPVVPAPSSASGALLALLGRREP